MRIASVLILLVCLVACKESQSGGSGESQTATADAGEPVWQDEFEASTLNTNKWTIIEGNGCPELCGFGNNELQTYTSAPENVKIEDGKLIITARKDDDDYTSAKLVTEGNGDWKYGYVEVRAKLPKGRGTWPAIWMLPSLDRSMKWPHDGEIDIMEHVGYNQGMLYATIHTEKFNHVQGTQKSDSLMLEDASEAFHTYAIDWTKEGITWYLDGEEYFAIEKGDEQKPGWPFDQEFHLILNTAIGGDWGGKEGVDDSIWPQTFEIDYVRVYDQSPL